MGRWVTSKGRRVYIPDEGEESPYAKKSGKKKERNILGEEVDFEEYARNMEKNKDDWAVEYDLSKVDMKQEEKERKARERADEEDYYDLTHNEGRYATTSKSINKDNMKKVTDKAVKLGQLKTQYNMSDENIKKALEVNGGDIDKLERSLKATSNLTKSINKDNATKEKQIAENKKQIDSLNGKSNKSSLEKANSQARINAENSKVLNKLYEERQKFSKAGDGRFIVDFEQFGGTMQAFKALAKAEGFEVLDSDADSVTLRRKKK